MSDLDSVIRRHLVAVMDSVPAVRAEEAIERAQELVSVDEPTQVPAAGRRRFALREQRHVLRRSTVRRAGVVAFATALLIVAVVVIATRGTNPPKPSHLRSVPVPVHLFGANIVNPGPLVVSGGDVFIGASGYGDAVYTVEETTAGALVREIPGFVPLLATGGTLVATDYGKTIAEIDIASGRLVRTIKGPQYHFTSVSAAAVRGVDLFVSNDQGSSVTEVNLATGALIRVMARSRYAFNQITDLAVAGRDLLVTNANSVTEIDAESGRLLRVLTSGASFAPTSPALSGSDLFVIDNRSTLVEFDLGNGAVVRVIPALPNGYDGIPFPAPSDTIVDGSHLFVDIYESGLVEYDVASGRLIRAIDAPTYHPGSMALSGRYLLVAEGGSSVTEVDTVTGKVVGGLYGSAYDFAGPDAEVVSGDTLFVANGTSGLTEMNAATGALIRVSDDPRLVGAKALAAVGGVVFVADDLGTECSSGSVVEVSATSGQVLRVISGRRFHLDCPSAIAIGGNDLFVGSYQYLTEIDARSGALVRVIASRGHGFNSVDAMSVAGQTLFVASEFATSADQRSATTIAEINTRTGNLIKLLGGPRYRFESPSAMAVSGPDLFVTNGGTGNAGTAGASVTEINAATGAVVRVIVGRQYRFDYPDVIAVAGNHLLVTSGNGGPVTEIDASTGALVRVISLSPSRALLFFAAGAIAVWHDRVYVSDVGANTVVEFAA